MTQDPKADRVLKLTLLENAHSFLVEALKKALAGESAVEEWKYAILHACQAVELALKERLAREHVSLILVDVDRPTRTVTPDVAMSRLRQYCGVVFRSADVAAIRQAIKWRHCIVHHEVALDVSQAKSTFAVLLGFLMHFHQSVLQDELPEAVPEQLWREALSIKQYGDEALRRALERMKAEGLVQPDATSCQKCGLKALVDTSDAYRCFACGTVDDIGVCDSCHEELPYSQLKPYKNWIDEDEYITDLLCDDCYSREPDWG